MGKKNRLWVKRAGLVALASFGASLALAGAVTPGIYDTLKAQSYYGRSQLTLTAEPVVTNVARGGVFELHYVLDNAGDAPATDVRLSFADVRSLRGLETVGCANDPAGYPVCLIGSPLRPGDSARVALFARVDRNAQAPVRVQAVAGSSDPGAERSRVYNATQTPLGLR